MDCHLAGRKYYDVDEVWENLKVGTELKLEHDTLNHYDPNAIEVIYESEGERYKLGYVPQEKNVVLAAFLQMGWDDVFECRINKLDSEAYSEQQIRLTIRIRRNFQPAPFPDEPLP